MHLAILCNQITTQRKWWILLYIAVWYQGYLLECVLCRGLVYHDKCYLDYLHIPYHEHFLKEHFVLLYHDDTVDVHYKNLGDDMISVVVHDKHW